MSHIPSDAEPGGSPSRYRQQAGIGHVPSYQVAATPYLTGTLTLHAGIETQVSFPRVTRKIGIINTGPADLRLSFCTTGSAAGRGGTDVHGGYHYITLEASGSTANLRSMNRDRFEMEIKCEELYVSNLAGQGTGAFELYAELTHIPTGSWTLTGTGISSPVGT